MNREVQKAEGREWLRLQKRQRTGALQDLAEVGSASSRPAKDLALEDGPNQHRSTILCSSHVMCRLPHWSVVGWAVWAAGQAAAAGIPEPGFVLYGVVENVDRGQTNRMTQGTLVCQITPPGAAPITIRTNLQNINDQFSYVLIVPFESRLAGMTLSDGVLELRQEGSSYSRAASVDGLPVRFAFSSATNFSFGPLDRGKLERVDLVISTQPADNDGNGLPDAWEMAHFGHLAVDPQADPDRDGLSNRQEFVAGTDPNDTQSAFRLISITLADPSGLVVQWASVAGRNYSLLRSADLFGTYSVVSSNVVATPPVNTFRDGQAMGAATWFYKLRIENP